MAFALCVSGRAPATVQEQRARLPPPKTCTDPVEGVWRSHAWHEGYAEWNIFTLYVHRVDGDDEKLKGEITNEAWFGPKSEENRGPCEGRVQYDVSMDAEGTIRGQNIEFHGVGQWRLDADLCAGGPGGYNLDAFSGTIDPETQEFISMNNDGGRFINVKTVFRRVECFDGTGEDEGPRVKVSPPAFYPESESAQGCGCR